MASSGFLRTSLLAASLAEFLATSPNEACDSLLRESLPDSLRKKQGLALGPVLPVLVDPKGLVTAESILGSEDMSDLTHHLAAHSLANNTPPYTHESLPLPAAPADPVVSTHSHAQKLLPAATDRKDSAIQLVSKSRQIDDLKFYFPLGNPSRPNQYRPARLPRQQQQQQQRTERVGLSVEAEVNSNSPSPVSDSEEDDDDEPVWLPERKPEAEMMTDLKLCFNSPRPPNSATTPPTRLPTVLYRDEMWGVTAVLCVPRYCSGALFDKVWDSKLARDVTQGERAEHEKQEKEDDEAYLTFEDVERWWNQLMQTYHDDHALVFKIMQKDEKSKFLTPSDFEPVVDEVIQRHPGLEFLSTLAVFQARYAETVITRIFFSKLHNQSERMTLPEFRKHAFLELLIQLQLDDDINATRNLFSYKHFYVLYCKFWELDPNHDMKIEVADMARYDRGALTDLCMSRVVAGYGRPLSLGNASAQMTYKDFVWFMLSVEDKRAPASLEYWFR
ncbi:Serine/threonine-protein phosphatase 2A regulatory subunit B'' subunit alpha, partial [Podochytrium sp. JEL0797]